MNWKASESTLICILRSPSREQDSGSQGRDVMLLVNASGDSHDFLLPTAAKSVEWRLFIDTSAESPNDIFPQLDGPLAPQKGRLKLTYRSLRCYVAEK